MGQIIDMAGKSAGSKSEGPTSSDFPVRFNTDGMVDRFRQAIRQAGGNQVVSQKSGVPKGTIENLLRGTEIRFSAAAAIAQACDVSTDWLWSGKAEFWPEWYREMMTGRPYLFPSGSSVAVRNPDFKHHPPDELAGPFELHEEPPVAPPPIDKKMLERAIELVRAITKGEELSPADAAERIGNAYDILLGAKS